MDVTEVYAAGQEAVAHVRAGKGPFLLEMKTYRYRGHSMSDPAKYRSKEEVELYKEQRDPIEGLKGKLIREKLTTEAALDAMDKEVKAIVNDAAEFAKQSPEPDAAELWTDVTV